MTKEELEQVYDCLDGGFGETSGKLSAHITALEAESERLKKVVEIQKDLIALNNNDAAKFREESEELKAENKDLKSKLSDSGDWICNGNEEQSAIDPNQSWGVFG